MSQTNEESRYADRRDDYRNGFVDAIAYLRGEFPPTEQQIESALHELQGFRQSTAVITPRHGPGEKSQCSRIDAVQR
jgi:hypothetical protein